MARPTRKLLPAQAASPIAIEQAKRQLADKARMQTLRQTKFAGFSDITTPLLESLKGMRSVPLMQAFNLLKQGGITGQEKILVANALNNIIRQKQVPVQALASLIHDQYFPLTREKDPNYSWYSYNKPSRTGGENYENVAYNGPFKTKAGGVHAQEMPREMRQNYVAHVRNDWLPEPKVPEDTEVMRLAQTMRHEANKAKIPSMNVGRIPPEYGGTPGDFQLYPIPGHTEHQMLIVFDKDGTPIHREVTDATGDAVEDKVNKVYEEKARLALGRESPPPTPKEKVKRNIETQSDLFSHSVHSYNTGLESSWMDNWNNAIGPALREAKDKLVRYQGIYDEYPKVSQAIRQGKLDDFPFTQMPTSERKKWEEEIQKRLGVGRGTAFHFAQTILPAFSKEEAMQQTGVEGDYRNRFNELIPGIKNEIETYQKAVDEQNTRRDEWVKTLPENHPYKILKNWEDSWPARILHEELKQAAKEGATHYLVPTADTLARHEGFIQDSGNRTAEPIQYIQLPESSIGTKFVHGDTSYYVTKHLPNNKFEARFATDLRKIYDFEEEKKTNYENKREEMDNLPRTKKDLLLGFRPDHDLYSLLDKRRGKNLKKAFWALVEKRLIPGIIESVHDLEGTELKDIHKTLEKRYPGLKEAYVHALIDNEWKDVPTHLKYLERIEKPGVQLPGGKILQFYSGNPLIFAKGERPTDAPSYDPESFYAKDNVREDIQNPAQQNVYDYQKNVNEKNARRYGSQIWRDERGSTYHKIPIKPEYATAPIPVNSPSPMKGAKTEAQARIAWAQEQLKLGIGEGQYSPQVIAAARTPELTPEDIPF